MKTYHATPAERNRARALRREGRKLKDIGQTIGRHHSVIQRWCIDIKPGVTEAKIKWDAFDHCWRICVRDKDRDPAIPANSSWWKQEWLQFENRQAAKDFAERNGKRFGWELAA